MRGSAGRGDSPGAAAGDTGMPPGTKLNIVVWHEVAEFMPTKTGEEIEVKGETTKDFVIPAAKVK